MKIDGVSFHVADANTLICTDEPLPEKPPEGYRQNPVHKNTYHKIAPVAEPKTEDQE